MSPLDNVDHESNPGDKELEEFIQKEQKRAQYYAQVHRLNEVCWKKCMTDRPSSKLPEACFTNCVERFIDTSVIVAQRFASVIQKQSLEY